MGLNRTQLGSSLTLTLRADHPQTSSNRSDVYVQRPLHVGATIDAPLDHPSL
jgi:hypothetical protein